MTFYGRVSTESAVGAAKTFKNSGGDAAISLASVANGTARQSAKIDLTASRGPSYTVTANFELAATPTAGNAIDLYWAPSPSAAAGTNEVANIAGVDSAYTGYSSNLTDSIKQLQFIGSFICTAQATATVQKAVVGRFTPLHRYGTLVVVNNSGAAFHSTNTNQQVVFTPITDILDAA